MKKRITDSKYSYYRVSLDTVASMFESHSLDSIYAQLEFYNKIENTGLVTRLIVCSRIDREDTVVREIKLYDYNRTTNVLDEYIGDKTIDLDDYLLLAGMKNQKVYEYMLRFYRPLNSNDKTGDKILLTNLSTGDLYLYCDRKYGARFDSCLGTVSPSKQDFVTDFLRKV